jgi:hypothetical protein
MGRGLACPVDGTFSWFVAQQFTHDHLGHPGLFASAAGESGDENEEDDEQEELERHTSTDEWRQGIVTGDKNVIKRILKEFGEMTVAGFSGRFLPAHTMTVRMRAGHNLDPDLRAALIS